MVFVSADHHFGHHSEEGGSIIRYENRPYKTLEEMDWDLIKRWNAVVKNGDMVFHLGDFSFYNKVKTIQIFRNLAGRKVLILGNHDKARSVSWWKDVGFEEVIKYPIIYDKFFIFSHEPVYLNDNMPYVNVHGHLHSKKMDSKQYINVSVENTDYAPVLFNDIKNRFNIDPGE
jgi:calcineurin-like phosphoesterase family protein